MVELRGDAGEIADAVAVRIREAARIDLVDRRAAPPGHFARRSGGLVPHDLSCHRTPHSRAAGQSRERSPARLLRPGKYPASVVKRVERVSTRTFWSTGSVDVLNKSSISLPGLGIEARDGEQARLVG